MSAVGSWVVAERELLRLGRRWQTQAGRATFALFLFGVVGLVYGVQRTVGDMLSVTAMQEVGRALFQAWAWAQMAFVTVLTPLTVAQAIIDEKDEQTLQLLSITRLSSRKILWGKLLSRLLGLEAMMLAGLPVLAVLLGFGGVGPGEMFSAFLFANLTMFGLAAVATFLALYATSPLVVVFQTWGWMFLGQLAASMLAGIGMLGGGGVGALVGTPWMALSVATLGTGGAAPFPGAVVIVPTVMWLGCGLLTMHVAALCFETLALGSAAPDADEEMLSSGFWPLNKFTRRLWPLGGLLLLLSPLLAARAVLGSSVPIVPELFSWLWIAAAWNLGGLVHLLLVRRTTLRRNKAIKEKGARRPVGWRRFVRWAEASDRVEADRAAERARRGLAGVGEATDEATEGGAGPRGVRGPRGGVREALSGRRGFALPRLGQRRVWDNPVAWRELRTAAHGPLRRWVLLFYGITAAILSLTLLAGAFDERGVAFGMGVAIVCGLPPITLLIATSSIVTERRTGTLPLLVATRLGPARVVWGKLLGVGGFLAPGAGVGALLMVLGSAAAGRNGLFVVLAGLAWLVAVNAVLALACFYRALDASTPTRAWAFNVVASMVVGWGLLALTTMSAAFKPLRPLWGFIVPFVFVDSSRGLLPVYTVLSALLWAALAALLFVLCAWRLARRAATG